MKFDDRQTIAWNVDGLRIDLVLESEPKDVQAPAGLKEMLQSPPWEHDLFLGVRTKNPRMIISQFGNEAWAFSRQRDHEIARLAGRAANRHEFPIKSGSHIVTSVAAEASVHASDAYASGRLKTPKTTTTFYVPKGSHRLCVGYLVDGFIGAVPKRQDLTNVKVVKLPPNSTNDVTVDLDPATSKISFLLNDKEIHSYTPNDDRLRFSEFTHQRHARMQRPNEVYWANTATPMAHVLQGRYATAKRPRARRTFEYCVWIESDDTPCMSVETICQLYRFLPRMSKTESRTGLFKPYDGSGYFYFRPGIIEGF